MDGKLVFFKDLDGINNFGHVDGVQKYESGNIYRIKVITDGDGQNLATATLISNGPWATGVKILGFFNISDGALIYERFTEGHNPVVTFNTQANEYKTITPTPDSTSQTTSGAPPQAEKQLTAEANPLKDMQESLDEAVATISKLKSDLVNITGEKKTLLAKNRKAGDDWMTAQISMKATYAESIEAVEAQLTECETNLETAKSELTECETKLQAANSQNAGGKRKKSKYKRKSKRKKRSKRR